MKCNDVCDRIIQLCKDKGIDFSAKGLNLKDDLKKCATEEIVDHLHFAGVIPERFGHDSTEEKVFAKYCDALLSTAWSMLGLDAQLVPERSDAADVIATGEGYRIVGDAKAFRLSRTAKNQKDFKVEALNQWRKGAEYACLVAPLYQYPNTTSQIYQQAIRYNVTLLSYTHLAFLIVHRQKEKSLKKLWEIQKEMKEGKEAKPYWRKVNGWILDCTGKTPSDWEKATKLTYASLALQAKDQIAFWEKEKQRIKNLTLMEAIKQLIHALKIDAKIKVIRDTAGV